MPPLKPTQLPYPATEANRQHLQQWLLNYYASSTFNTCEHQPLSLMDTLPLRLMVNPDATPVAHHSPVPVPLHWRDEVKAGLDRNVELGVLEPVPVGEPVTWCHRMVICAKKNGKPRRTVDFQALNIHATRETHHTQSPFHQAHSVPCNTKKTVLDCWNGYHSVPLHPDDRHLTTFITPWGRYHYKTAPRATLLLAMASPDDMTKLSQTNQTKPSVLMIPYCGLMTSPAASFKLWTGWIHVAGMGSSSIPKNLPLAPTQSPLLALRLHPIMLDHVNSTWTPSAIFPDHKT